MVGKDDGDCGGGKGGASSTAAAPLGLAGAVKLVVRTFLEKKHYRHLTRVLSQKWSSSHSLTAAVRLMEAHGVTLTLEEEQRLVELPEERMIDWLVARMPQQTREQFEQFFLQLASIASTTTRLRTGIETGDTDLVDEVLESAEKVGIISFLLKMAVTQAGLEVRQKETAHEQWLQETEERMTPLLQSQAQSLGSQKALAQAKNQLMQLCMDESAKCKKVLLSFVANEEVTLQAQTFLEWAHIMRENKREAEVLKEYEEELAASQRALLEYKGQQLENLRGLFLQQAEASNTAAVVSCFNALRNEVANAKVEREASAKAKELQAKLSEYSEAAAENARKVLASMNSMTAESLTSTAWSAWRSYIEDYRKDKEMNDAVKKAESRLVEFKDRATSTSKTVVMKMMSQSENGLITSFFSIWSTYVREEKEADAMQEAINAKAGNLAEFGQRNKLSAFGEMERMQWVTSLHCLLQIFMYWKRWMRLEAMRRFGQEKNNKKKQQLLGVKGLFKNFALELESGLKEGTPRVAVAKTRHRSRS